MVIYKATGHSLRATYLFSILVFVFILYSTFLTRTGVLGDTSVHAFTEAGKAINVMIISLVLAFALPILFLFFRHYKYIPAIYKEEQTSSREFWMFIGSLVLFLTALFIIAKTSVPVINEVFGTKIAPPEEIEFSYNKVAVLVAIIIGLLTAVSQYLKYKSTTNAFFLKKIAIPTLIAAVITTLIVVFYPMNFHKHGAGFLGAIYVALFATIYSFIANATYIFAGLKGNLRAAGGSVAHAGFALMLVGILISGSNKQVISSSLSNGINLPAGKDPMTKQTDDPTENLTLLREVPTKMANYDVTYLKDSSSGLEKGRKFYELQFEAKDPITKKVIEKFTLSPDVYLMKDNNMSSNPDTKSYLTKDIFTYISYALSDKKEEDTTSFNEVELREGDTSFFSKGYFILNKVVKNPVNERYQFKPTDVALMADITVVSKDSMHYHAMPLLQVDEFGIVHTDDTLYAQNLFVRFMGVSNDKKIRIGTKLTDKMIDFVTVKSYMFPYINLVWLGLIIMAVGLMMSMIKRAAFSNIQAAIALLFVGLALFYMFLFAN